VVESEIDHIETQTIDRLAAPPDNRVQQIELLGKTMLYDKELSVNRNEACVFCHMPETGFTGPISELNRTTGAYPGSVRTRYSERKPQTRVFWGGEQLDTDCVLHHAFRLRLPGGMAGQLALRLVTIRRAVTAGRRHLPE
jgi:hypothetical protein